MLEFYRPTCPPVEFRAKHGLIIGSCHWLHVDISSLRDTRLQELSQTTARKKETESLNAFRCVVVVGV